MFHRQNIIRIAVGFTGILFILLGIQQGDLRDTMQKAIMICLQCIGIG